MSYSSQLTIQKAIQNISEIIVTLLRMQICHIVHDHHILHNVSDYITLFDNILYVIIRMIMAHYILFRNTGIYKTNSIMLQNLNILL